MHAKDIDTDRVKNFMEKTMLLTFEWKNAVSSALEMHFLLSKKFLKKSSVK